MARAAQPASSPSATRGSRASAAWRSSCRRSSSVAAKSQEELQASWKRAGGRAAGFSTSRSLLHFLFFKISSSNFDLPIIDDLRKNPWINQLGLYTISYPPPGPSAHPRRPGRAAAAWGLRQGSAAPRTPPTGPPRRRCGLGAQTTLCSLQVK